MGRGRNMPPPEMGDAGQRGRHGAPSAGREFIHFHARTLYHRRTTLASRMSKNTDSRFYRPLVISFREASIC